MDTRINTRIALFLLVVFSSSQALGAVGNTAGSADVSATGEANYSIPIFAPPGTHGMTPQLAFVYGHRNLDTLLGVGWSIAGCPPFHAALRSGRQMDRRETFATTFRIASV
jgi:hypothetical protein